MFLSQKTFSTVIENAPLVSLDLVVENEAEQVLLGQRLNKPAKGSWFVPGGRVLKNESLSSAFKRLTFVELGEAFDIQNADLLGAYDHFYSDNVFGSNFSTHYVAIGYKFRVNKILTKLPQGVQHGGYRWCDIDSLLQDESVHSYTKNYVSNLNG
ncbi:GDP-mannose mannosyl hydrolase [Paraglaciecola sp. 2405UD69-4]|uniref:GDP-mannose mannosyl hydrolase n=1 Tax=Paraglaciecola sp. 2405UD69-4 TaxID=3391836 RepID=UPI0039C8F135